MFWYWRSRFREYLATSLWVVPMLMAVAGLVAGRLVVAVDRHTADIRITYSESQATSVLTALSGGLLAFIGLIITMLLLIPQFAGSQLTPRVLAIWYRQTAIKLVLGFFFASATFDFFVLSSIREDETLSLAVIVAGFLTLFSFIFFLWFVNSFVAGLRPATMATSVARRCHTVIRHTYPHPYQGERPDVTTRDVVGNAAPASVVLNEESGGYVLSVNTAALVSIAQRIDGVLVFPHVVGEYVLNGQPLVEVYAARAPHPRWMQRMIAVGAERTPQQDPAYVMRILVDMAATALSPAINAPTTAIQVLDRIDELLHLLARQDFGDGTVRDADGAIRLIVPRWTWPAYLRLATREIGYYGADNAQVNRRLLAMLERLLRTVPDERRPAAEAELCLLRRRIERSFVDPEELATAAVPDPQGLGFLSDQ
jgi:uncharacterized membrane protein